jgi:hypothetical protein
MTLLVRPDQLDQGIPMAIRVQRNVSAGWAFYGQMDEVREGVNTGDKAGPIC